MTLSPELTEELVEDPFQVDAPQTAVAGRRRRRRQWAVVLVLAAFLLSRGFAGYVADHPDFYGPNRPDGTGDVHRYDELTWMMRHDDASPYGQTLRMEYPP
ncbi:MAG: hypothetical protein QOD38_1675, partial [Acidimicrobiaceae bacterium]